MRSKNRIVVGPGIRLRKYRVPQNGSYGLPETFVLAGCSRCVAELGDPGALVSFGTGREEL